jgi:hypothetical protein
VNAQRATGFGHHHRLAPWPELLVHPRHQRLELVSIKEAVLVFVQLPEHCGSL